MTIAEFCVETQIDNINLFEVMTSCYETCSSLISSYFCLCSLCLPEHCARLFLRMHVSTYAVAWYEASLSVKKKRKRTHK
jgi:hypothetical protein